MSFQGTFLVVSPETFGNPKLNETGKVILPENVMTRIISSGFHDQVMLFTLKNPQTQKKIAVGVQEFTADQVSCIIPNWICRFIGLTENDKVHVELTRFKKCTEAVFQPIDETFNKLPNPRIILEHTLRDIPCLTQGSIIDVPFAGNIYQLKVLFLKPEGMVNTIGADVSTQFARPISDFDHHWGEEEEFNDTDKQKEDNMFKGVAHTIKK